MTVDLTPQEQSEAAEMLADLHERGYINTERFEYSTGVVLEPGMRVRHSGERYYEAIAGGTGNIVAITEKPDSAWSHSWGAADVEMIVAFDKPRFEGSSRLSQLAQYHVAVVGQ